MDLVNVDGFCKYLRSRKYKVSKKDDVTFVLSLPTSVLSPTLLEVRLLRGENKVTISTRCDGKLDYFIYNYDDGYTEVANKSTYLFNVKIGGNKYHNLLNIILHLYGLKGELLTGVAVLFENIYNKKDTEIISRAGIYNNYPPIESFGNPVGYVLEVRIAGSAYNYTNTVYYVVDKNVAGSTLDKYFCEDSYLCYAYTGKPQFDKHLDAKKLAKLLKQLDKN